MFVYHGQLNLTGCNVYSSMCTNILSLYMLSCPRIWLEGHFLLLRCVGLALYTSNC
ncbi:unnamed protein product [Prunus brigantina]